MFFKLYLGELKKFVRPKAIITLLAFFVIFFVLFAVVYNINIEEMLQQFIEMGYVDTEGNPISEEEYYQLYDIQGDLFASLTPENIDNEIATYRSYYEAAKAEKNGGEYHFKSMVTMLEYVKANGLYGQEITVEGYHSYLFASAAETFTGTYFSVVLLIVTIYAIVSAAGSYADEYKNGTLKLIMLRPITRNQLTTAKLLSLFTVLTAVLGFTTLVAFLYGLAAFGTSGSRVIYLVFNASSVIKSTLSGVVMWNIFCGWLSLLVTALLSFTIGATTRKKTMAIILSFLIYLGVFSLITGLLKLERFTLSANMSLAPYLSVSSLSAGANFFIALPVLCFYIALMLFLTYFITKKRDIA